MASGEEPPRSIEELSDLARFLEFDLVHRDEGTYALLRGGTLAFEGQLRECFSFLIGWRADRVDMIRALVPGSAEDRAERDMRQRMVTNWAREAFGHDQATSVPQRGLRLLEEAIEAFQASGGDEAMAHKLVTFVFARPPGTVGQELGGVAVTVLLLAAAAGLSADEEECREIHRVLSKPVSEFTERNANKNAAGFKIS